MNEDQVKHMVNRFLGWKLPADFSPDAGISFKADFNEHTAHPMKHEPSGTNLLDARQAEAMIRYLLDGLPPPQPNVEALSEDAVRRVMKLLDVYAPDVFTLEMAAGVVSTSIEAVKMHSPQPASNLISAAVEEYLLDHPRERDEEKLGRHSAIRGLMVRLGKYPEFVVAVNQQPTSTESSDNG